MNSFITVTDTDSSKTEIALIASGDVIAGNRSIGSRPTNRMTAAANITGKIHQGLDR